MRDTTTLGRVARLHICKSSGEFLYGNDPDCKLEIQEKMIDYAFEYAPDKMIVHTRPTDLLVVHNWKIVGLIRDDKPGNLHKLMILPLPGFDEETFPFMLCSGYESFDLVNIRDLTIEALIMESSKTRRAQ